MTRFRLFVDSADEAAVATLLDTGLVHGVTTNPTILRKAGAGPFDIQRLHAAWSSTGARRLFFQAWGPDVPAMLACGRQIAALGSDVTVKVPATGVGFAVASALVADGTAVLVTAVYSTGQAIAAASIGAEFIAPYLGRMEDSGRDGVGEIADMHDVVDGTGTSVLAASLRTPDAIVSLARRGVRAFTAAPEVIWKLLQDDTSDASAEVFESDSSA